MKKFLVIITIWVLASNAVCQDTVRHFAYGTTGPEECVRGFEYTDGYLFFGSTGSVGNGEADIYIVKTDRRFEPVSFVTLGSAAIEKLASVDRDTGNSSFYLLSTFYNAFGNGSYDLRIDHVDSGLSITSTRIVGTESIEEGVFIHVSVDRVYVLFSRGLGTEKVFWMNIYSKSLDLEQTIELGLAGEFNPVKVLTTQEEGFYILGDGIPADSANSDIILRRYSNSGELFANWNYGGADEEIASSLIEKNDSTLLIIGSTRGFAAGPNDFNLWLLDVDTSGYLNWAQVHGDIFDTVNNKDDFGVEVLVHSDHIFVAMNTTAYGQGEWDYHLHDLFIDGSYSTGNSFGLNASEELRDLFFSSDSLFVLSGNTYSTGQGQTDFFIVTTPDAYPLNKYKEYFEYPDTLNGQSLNAGNVSNAEINIRITHDRKLLIQSSRHAELVLYLMSIDGKIIRSGRLSIREGLHEYGLHKELTSGYYLLTAVDVVTGYRISNKVFLD